jgi:hypothetical protein
MFYAGFSILIIFVNQPVRYFDTTDRSVTKLSKMTNCQGRRVLLSCPYLCYVALFSLFSEFSPR